MLPTKSGLARTVSQFLSVFAKPKTKKAYLLYSLDQNKIIRQYNQNHWFEAASLTKLVYGIDSIRKIEHGEIKNKKIEIENKFLFDEGTNILRDLKLENTGTLRLPIKTLIRLMLKHSCNGSTLAIWNQTVIPYKQFCRRLKNIWSLNTKIFDKTGNFQNIMKPLDFLMIYRYIYDNRTNMIRQDSKKFLQEILEEGKDRYSIFDQKSINIKILGCKGGQLFNPQNSLAFYHDSGVFLVKNTNKKYIIITMTQSNNLASNREWTRKIGKKLLSQAESIK